MSLARKSGMRGSEREEVGANPADRGTNPHGGVSQHVHVDENGDHHFNLSTAVAELERQKTGPHDDREGAFKKPNAPKFTPGATKDSKKDSEGNEYD